VRDRPAAVDGDTYRNAGARGRHADCDPHPASHSDADEHPYPDSIADVDRNVARGNCHGDQYPGR